MKNAQKESLLKLKKKPYIPDVAIADKEWLAKQYPKKEKTQLYNENILKNRAAFNKSQAKIGQPGFLPNRYTGYPKKPLKTQKSELKSTAVDNKSPSFAGKPVDIISTDLQYNL